MLSAAPLGVVFVRYGSVTAYDDTTGELGTGTAEILTDYDDGGTIKNQGTGVTIDILSKYPDAITSGMCGYVIPGLGGYHAITVGCNTISLPPGP